MDDKIIISNRGALLMMILSSMPCPYFGLIAFSIQNFVYALSISKKQFDSGTFRYGDSLLGLPINHAAVNTKDFLSHGYSPCN